MSQGIIEFEKLLLHANLEWVEEGKIEWEPG